MASNYLYTPPSVVFNNEELNAMGSLYASTYGHDSQNVISQLTRDIIYDSAPKQYVDLRVLNMKTPRQVGNDEFYYQEMGYGRAPAISSAQVASPGVGAKQTITVYSNEMVSKDCIVIYPNNVKGTITDVNTNGLGLTIAPLTGGTLPQIEVNDKLAILSPVEADGADSISQYFRQGTIERSNFVQMLVKGMRFGKMELFKLQNGSVTSNYLTMQKASFMNQFRVDLSNIYWNGTKGEVLLANDAKAKTAGGVYPIMVDTGSPYTSCAVGDIGDAIEDIALQTNYGDYGEVKMLYGAPEYILAAGKFYKETGTRYTPNDNIAKLGLTEIDFGFTRIVLVPMKRFEDSASFPVAFAKRLFLLDQESITPVIAWGEEIGETMMRQPNGNLNTYQDHWISGTFSIEFNNPLGCGYIDIN